PELTHDLRAGSYHPPTLEMLDQLGVTEEMHKTGIKVPRWQIRDRVEGLVAEFDLSLVADETPYPYRLHLEQHRLTPILLDKIRDTTTSVEIHFGTEVTGIEPDLDGVTVRLDRGDEHRASFFVGCDGARSLARKIIDVDFKGFTWPDRFLVASTTFQLDELGFSGAGYVADPEHWAAIFHVPDTGPPGIWRIAYGTDPEEPEEDILRDERIQQRLNIILEHSNPGIDKFDLKYRSTYRVHQRVASQFYRGRIAIAGDAAHLNNPMGGLGLNGGVHDAISVGEKIRKIWHDNADFEAQFNHYDHQRRPINIKAVQAMSIRNKKLLEERDPGVRRERLNELKVIASDPVKSKAHLMNTSMINSVREAAAVPLEETK
ncbi:MAG: FAD-dependent oxidoreductase, partial [Methyloligellaceae bacterium]